MQRRIRGVVTAVFAVCASLAWITTCASALGAPPKAEFYTSRVKPIFDANCGRCHSGLNHRGGLNIDTRESLLKGGHTGPAIVPGDPAKSLLVTLIRHEGPGNEPKNMPPNKPKLSDSDIQVVETWIKTGASMPPQAH